MKNKNILIPKRQQCFDLAKSEEWKKCFSLAKGFDKLFSKENIDKISISYECLNNEKRASFYKMLGIDIENTLLEAKNIILEHIKNIELKNNI